jgi:tetratricopeptide (TPR) repeat protein
MRSCRSISSLAILILLIAAPATAQTRGTGRLAGKVLDGEGKPIRAVLVTAVKTGDDRPVQTKTSEKGEWAIGGLAGGQWNLDFAKDGFQTKGIAVQLSEVTRIPPMEIRMTKAAPPPIDPNVEIKEHLVKAAALMEGKKFADARAVYMELLAKFPEAHQLQPLIARTYAGENQHEKALEHLRLALEKDPGNVEVKLLLGNTLIEKGDAAEGKQILAAIDMSQVKDPLAFINSGIALINEGKAAEAATLFDKVIERFPSQADGYYFRGLARLQLGQTAEAKADLQKYVTIAPADAPELAQAKKILEQLK